MRDRDRSPQQRRRIRTRSRSRSRSPPGPARHRDARGVDARGDSRQQQQQRGRNPLGSMAVEAGAGEKIDREKTCPLLLRVFCTTKHHHPLSDFSQGRTPANELQIYTWLDATLKELSLLVQEVNPDSRAKGTYFDFAVIYADNHTSRYKSRDIGTVCNGARGMDDNVTLKDRRFHIGDYIDISICQDGGGGGGGGGGSSAAAALSGNGSGVGRRRQERPERSGGGGGGRRR